ncbi:uncharacterized protein C8Q71DRAFT_366915 [Rhodofomes roseus]|uniref:Uncharacterized protein n=1 Tax=Rhodofomes roseus TaxID=34475 RepID=A0ABQ8K1B4_9APHY|nr:uncharacterized protein C8Q71DRAFT_366915 [Rhodofomes roseus]KAH9830460.1 hypothetical protein C8Q71DRAFT_366915 [Rhodofomes roseus]
MPSFAARCIFLCCFFYLPFAWANTEIVNFVAMEGSLTPSQAQALQANWTVLSAAAPEKLLRVPPAPLGTPLADVCHPSHGASCSHELWLALRLDDPAWRAYSRFTLRVSWPASSPADFDIQVKSAEALFNELQAGGLDNDFDALHTGRRMYARIRVVDAGVRVPTADGSRERVTPEPVPFIVILEPLYFGMLPASVAPTVAFLVIVIIIAAFGIVPPVQRYLGRVADEVRQETASSRTKSD